MTVVQKLEAILLPRFPTVVLRDSYTIAPFAGRRYVDVFHIPDERHQEFHDFMYDELPALREAAGLADVHVDPHSVAYTREHFPEIPPRRARNGRRTTRSAPPARRKSSAKPGRRSAASSGGGSASRRRG